MATKNSRNFHVVPRGDQWAVTRQGDSTPLATRPTQAEAITAGQRIAQPTAGELHIHRPNGQIRDRRSYGNDPIASKG